MAIKDAQQAKIEKTLDKLIRYEEGVMSRRDWLKLKFKEGCTVEKSTKNRIQFDRKKFNRMCSYKEQEEYEAKCNEIVECFILKIPIEGYFFEITKTEFDFYQTF